ncbi:hypothetical protein BVE84_03690 [Streptococcus azizii]|uniref:Bacterial sugar transferase domain-containing protein n=1 Tax=Streptococcus azizii TaxID=1579424 RepID=A0AB36JT27_9STRE|nr:MULTISPECIES: sugar transferase [Streptococcus]ONK28375.1 hypothetical protein BVE86_03240 [Streptococcus azizii]ONK29000.1 hypothetical protein BVE85_03970 [Streptococcus azizii]ONK30174.1 hypothetical protein BVE84_03690 [Streptococcus azizii]TFU84660.1 sugar transferase [Streptococcus sp. AN2]
MAEREKIRYLLLLVMLQLVITFQIATYISKMPTVFITNSSIIVLCSLHIIAWNISCYSESFLQRDCVNEGIQILKYSLWHTILITATSILLRDVFTISYRGMFYFELANAACFYILSTCLKNGYFLYLKIRKGSRKLLVVTTIERVSDTVQTLTHSFKQYGDIVAIATMDGISHHEGIVSITKENLFSYLASATVDEVLVNLSIDYPIYDYILQFEKMGLDVHVVLNECNRYTDKTELGKFGKLNTLSLSANGRHYRHLLAKRLLDIGGSLLGLFICAIAYLFLAPKIKRDGGPAIFKQERIGRNGRVFDLYKFRSMSVDAEKQKEDLLHYNVMTGPLFKMDDDPRITPIGHFIRKTSLDELPQFYNVLKGEMSLVGPRPPTKDEYRQYTLEQKRRLSCRPGLTGLWQISGRSNITDFDEVVKLDLQYLDNWTIWLDFKILLKTLKVVWKRDGAK